MKVVIAKARLWLSLEEERAEGPQARPDPCIWEEAASGTSGPGGGLLARPSVGPAVCTAIHGAHL